ncbi:GNAT family N-acetyltransferase [Salegentibacter maritimus]|uniref:GNAT family N-acetyltransferase n=1 Tax=Salegentibacter maritimus TaxID=2794347 RepID=UPI0018E44EF2|nr:GNAT family N-acetyltransferase [Salegentibacter maritimus]MBI6118301.1 GNAT family N-acetyltransferase [Salegentibacter maritimus]
MKIEEEKLDNPVWYSLSEEHYKLSLEYHGIKFYQSEYCPFGGFIDHKTPKEGINKYFLLTDNFYVVGDKPILTDKVQLKKELVCNQMLLNQEIDFGISELIIELKTTRQKNDLFGLVNLVQPGYFKSKTSNLGNYYGIYKNDKLVAVTGERMKMDKYTEISAVVTHPEHTGNAYAKQLIKHTANKIFKENKIPYLHVAESNTGAIKLYEKLGFLTRRKISFWNLIKK